MEEKIQDDAAAKKDAFDGEEAPWRPPEEGLDEESPVNEAEATTEETPSADDAPGEQTDDAEAGATEEPAAPDAASDDEADATADDAAEADAGAGSDGDDTTDGADETGEDAVSDDALTEEISTESVVEAVLFATDEPVTPQKLVGIIGAGDVKTMRKHIKQLNKRYQQMGCAFRIEGVAGGYQMMTQAAYNPWLRKLLKVRSESKLSPAALETLAVIAYKQPVLRVDIEAIRGVAAGEMIRQLIEKQLVKIVGRADVIGRPLLYGTTKRFLEVFGLNNLKDLPTADELKKPE